MDRNGKTPLSLDKSMGSRNVANKLNKASKLNAGNKSNQDLLNSLKGETPKSPETTLEELLSKQQKGKPKPKVDPTKKAGTTKPMPNLSESKPKPNPVPPTLNTKNVRDTKDEVGKSNVKNTPTKPPTSNTKGSPQTNPMPKPKAIPPIQKSVPKVTPKSPKPMAKPMPKIENKPPKQKVTPPIPPTKKDEVDKPNVKNTVNEPPKKVDSIEKNLEENYININPTPQAPKVHHSPTPPKMRVDDDTSWDKFDKTTASVPVKIPKEKKKKVVKKKPQKLKRYGYKAEPEAFMDVGRRMADRSFIKSGELPKIEKPVVVNPIPDIMKSAKVGVLTEDDFTDEDVLWAKDYRKKQLVEDATKKKNRQANRLKNRAERLRTEANWIKQNDKMMDIDMGNGQTLADMLGVKNRTTDDRIKSADDRKRREVNRLIAKSKTVLANKLEEEGEELSKAPVSVKDDSLDLLTLTRGLAVGNLQNLETEYKLFDNYYRNGETYHSANELLLCKNLGIEPDELGKLMSIDDELSEREKKKLLGISDFKRKSIVDDKEIITTVFDRDILIFLGIFRYCVANILKNINGDSLSMVVRKLEKLRNDGLVENHFVPGVGNIWYLTSTGCALVNAPTRQFKPMEIKMTTLSEHLGKTYVASYLHKNRLNVLDLKPFPYKGRLVAGKKVPGERLISEAMILSSLDTHKRDEDGNFIKNEPGEKGTAFKVARQDSIALFNEWKKSGLNIEDAPDSKVGNEFMLSLLTKQDDQLKYKVKTFHSPDLVVYRERKENGLPSSIAVEIERKKDTPENYRKTFLSYQLEGRMFFEKVVWVCATESTAKRVREGARLAKMKPGTYNVVPLLDEYGNKMILSDFMELAGNV